MAGSSTPKRVSTNKTVTKPAPPKVKTYKFASLTAEAKAQMDEAERNRPVIPPFVLDDVDPPIVITAPDNLERVLVAAECFSLVERGDNGAIMPLLRALCGDAFPRIWWLVREDSGSHRVMALLNVLGEHFAEVLAPFREAADLPGGSEGSSD